MIAANTVPQLFLAAYFGLAAGPSTAHPRVAMETSKVPVRSDWGVVGDSTLGLRAFESFKRADAELPAIYATAQRELCSYLDLPEDWDGYGGEAPVERAIYDAMEILGACAGLHLPSPRAMVSSSGEVGLYWRDEAAYGEIRFPGDGTFYYLAEKPGVGEIGGEDLLVTGGLPEELIAFLRRA